MLEKEPNHHLPKGPYPGSDFVLPVDPWRAPHGTTKVGPCVVHGCPIPRHQIEHEHSNVWRMMLHVLLQHAVVS